MLGVYDESIASEVPLAFVTPGQGSEPSEMLGKDVTDWPEGQVSYPKRLRGGAQFVDQVPKNTTGKILRRLSKVKYGGKMSTAMKGML